MNSDTTVIIPFDDCVILVSLLNSAEFSSRFSEVAQTLDAISGIQFLAGGRGLSKPRPPARSDSAAAPECARGGWGALRSLDIRLLVVIIPPGGQSGVLCCDCPFHH